MHSPLTTIADVSSRFGVSHRALRFYEQRGLLRPVRIGRRRRYDAEEIDRVAVILKLKSFGFSLLEIDEILSKPGDGQFGLTAQQCEAQLHILRDQLADMRSAIAELETICPPGVR
jgi:DNA-binding transcriptional MerR regulator